MRKYIVFKFALFSLLLIFYQNINAAEYPAKDDKFPDITICAPQNQNEKDYLGLATRTPFRLSQIKTEVLIVEIFSMYCPYCQKEAPTVNELFTIINQRPDIKDRIKIIGIGVGNTPFEVDFFRDKYDVPFPLFPDESFSIHKTIGEVRTPYFFVLKINQDGSNKVIFSRVGTIQEPKEFLDLIIKETGLN